MFDFIKHLFIQKKKRLYSVMIYFYSIYVIMIMMFNPSQVHNLKEWGIENTVLEVIEDEGTDNFDLIGV
jgi:hypothetical protein